MHTCTYTSHTGYVIILDKTAPTGHPHWIIIYMYTVQCMQFATCTCSGITWSNDFRGLERIMRPVGNPTPARKPAHSKATSGGYFRVKVHNENSTHACSRITHTHTHTHTHTLTYILHVHVCTYSNYMSTVMAITLKSLPHISLNTHLP